MIVHGDRMNRAHEPSQVQRLLPPRDRDHARACAARQGNEDEAQKTDSDDRHRLALTDVAAAEDVHGAAEGLERQVELGQGVGQLHHLRGFREIIFGIGVAAKEPHAVANLEIARGFVDRVNYAPTFMTQRSRLGGELHPLGPFPGSEVRRANPAAFQPDAHLPRSGFGQRHAFNPDLAGAGDDGRPHGPAAVAHFSALSRASSTASGAMSRFSSSTSSWTSMPSFSAMAEVWRMSRVTSCSARRLTCRSSAARRSFSSVIRFWVMSTKVERKIASTDAAMARTTKLASHGRTPGIQPRLAVTQKPKIATWR